MNPSDAGEPIRPLPAAAAALVSAAGMWAVVAQTVLFRAFFETVEGSEFGVAAFFAAWLMWVAVGAAAGRGLARRSPSWPAVALAALAQLPATALQVLLTLNLRPLAGVSPHELFPIVRLLPLAWVVNAPVSFVTGLVFTAACGVARLGGGRSVARVYRLEALGAAAGGLGATLALSAGWAEERLALAGMALLAAAAAFASGRGARCAAPAALPLAAALTVALRLDQQLTERRDRFVWSRLLPVSAFRGRFATGQATYRFGEREGAWIAQSRESIVETVGAGDHAAATAAIYLSTVPTARRVLVAGPDTYGLALALLRLPSIERVVWAPPDPGFARAWPARLPPHLRPDPARMVALEGDLRAWLAATKERFDLIAIEAGPPLTLADHRLLTAEFLALVRARLTEGGVAGLRFPGGAAYLGPELSRLGAALAATAEGVFRHVLLQPGDESRWLMTDRISGFAPPLRLARLYAAIPGAERLAPADVVTAAFPPERAEAQLARYAQWRRRIGDDALRLSDARPAALIPALALGLRQAGHPRAAAVWSRSVRPAALALIAAMLAATALRLAARRRGRDAAAPVPLGEAALMIGATGAAGMTGALAVMLAWQTHHGSLFLHVGALSALYMTGAWVGASAGERIWMRGGPMPSRPPLWLVLALHLVLLASLGRAEGRLPQSALAAASAALGALGGAYVPFAARRLAGRLPEVSAGAILELFDHLGGMLGALVSGLVVIPALGLGGWAGWAAALLTAVLPASLPAPPVRRPVDDTADVVARRIGAVAGWWFLVAAVFTLAWRAEPGGDTGEALAAAARALLPDRELRPQTWSTPDGRRIRGYVAGPASSPEAWCFSTADVAATVPGYAGPIELAVALDRDGAILGVRVLRSRETPRYFERLQHWWGALRGWRIADPGAPPPVDAVSGATVSSRAVLDTLREAGPRFAAAVQLRGAHETAANRTARIPHQTLTLAAFALGALVLRRAPARRHIRILALAATAAVLGRWLNVQLSVAHLRVWLEWPWPAPGWNLAWVLPVAVPLLVALVGNVYCGWLCPFGAVQELAAALRPRRWRPPPAAAWREARWVKYALLGLAATAMLAAPTARLEDLDPLALAFAHDLSRPAGAAVLTLIAISWFVPRFWCRALCPTGAWLAAVAALRPLERFWPAVRPRACEFGVRARTDLDCLACDRCRDDAAELVAAAPVSVWRRWLGAMTAIALMAIGGAARHRPDTWTAATAAPTAEAEHPARRGGTALDEDTLRRIRERQRAGHLSDREAMYYSRLGPPEGSDTASPPRPRWRGGRPAPEEPTPP
ncbi:MAG: FMN-binding protein [Kiritimatiellae bacterium]|nr:FMN-binding protein [Kiritimatiellia bacterium]